MTFGTRLARRYPALTPPASLPSPSRLTVSDASSTATVAAVTRPATCPQRTTLSTIESNCLHRTRVPALYGME